VEQQHQGGGGDDGEMEEDADHLQFEDEWEDEYEEEDIAGETSFSPIGGLTLPHVPHISLSLCLGCGGGVADMEEDGDEEEEEGEREGKEGSHELTAFKIPKVSDQDEDDEDEDEDEENLQVFIPGRDQLEEGEVLDFDNSAYDMLHGLNVEWPCLSFDIITDKLGAQRTKFPMTAYMVAGTQADNPQNNKLMVMKLSNLCKTKHDDKGSDDEDDSSDDDSDNGDDTNNGEPLLETKTLKHHGGVNRVRCTRLGEDTTVAASWSETGKVHLWDLSTLVRGLDFPQHDKPPAGPLHTFAGHPTEGFALDWSPTTPGRLLSGDCRKYIHLWEMTGAGTWAVGGQQYTGHTASVEDLQWSPNEQNVFASCSVDKTIKIWDARQQKKSVLSVTAHASDVNVISWNRAAPHLLLSGCDDGTFSIWDLRNFKS